VCRGIPFLSVFRKTGFWIPNVPGFSKSYKVISNNSYEYFGLTLVGNSIYKITATFDITRGGENVGLRLGIVRNGYENCSDWLSYSSSCILIGISFSVTKAQFLTELSLLSTIHILVPCE
jgi:hypothetical protein